MGEASDSDEDDFRKPVEPQQQFPLFSYQGLIEASRPKTKARRRRFHTPQQDLTEMEQEMPNLDTSKLLPLLNYLPTDVQMASKTLSISAKGKLKTQKQRHIQRQTSEELSREKIALRKCDSVPLLSHGETLFEELGISDDRTESAQSMDNIEESEIDSDENSQQKQPQVQHIKPTKPEPGTWEYRQEDLKRLVGRGGEDDGKGADTEEDLPPLLQAVTSSEQQEARLQEIEQRLQVLDKLEEERRERERIEIREPTHPQPATVSTHMPDKTLVRTSDIRVSDRVCLSSITLKQHQTVYNDLIDEIDPSVVKKLDSNLFLGDEITEVYKEIMKTVPTDHLDLENDDHIEKAADSLNLSSALASSTLSKKKNERIINQDLRRDIDPPWGTLDVTDWAKTPYNPPKDVKGRAILHPMIPKGQGLAMNDFYGDGYGPPNDVKPQDQMPEVMARSYASWLTWWKNTINSDDYMKYLSTQETDYMGVIFHFYNSDDDDDDDIVTARTKAANKLAREQRKEKIQKLNEMKAQKTEFSDGFWNANAVLMGGLGQEPSLSDEDDEADPSTAASEPQNLSSQKARPQMISRKSQKTRASDTVSTTDPRSKTREGGVSQNSHVQSRAGTKHSMATSQKGDTELNIQERLEKVWTELHVPDNVKLDMAIKYSSDQYHLRLEDALEIWEEVTDLITQREKIVTKLETFERLASDPNRFFEKGQRGSSVARLEEARMRSLYYRKIDLLEEDLRPILELLERDYHDVVTYQGRPYKEKMRWDRTEMLFWLQEERKQQALEYEARIRHLTPLPHNLVQLGSVA